MDREKLIRSMLKTTGVLGFLALFFMLLRYIAVMISPDAAAFTFMATVVTVGMTVMFYSLDSD